MRPISIGTTILVQGAYTLLVLLILLDVGSPTFDLGGVSDWSGIEAAIAVGVALIASLALGVVMHTISRSIFHGQKLEWILRVLSSDTVRRRFSEVGVERPSPGGPAYADVLSEDTPHRARRAGEFMHGLEYQVMSQAFRVYRTIQVYRDQYRVARGFVIPSAALGFILPLWEPVAALDGAGAIGPFPIIRSQLFLLSVLAASVSYVAFRERAYRYAAAQTLAFVTLERERSRGD